MKRIVRIGGAVIGSRVRQLALLALPLTLSSAAVRAAVPPPAPPAVAPPSAPPTGVPLSGSLGAPGTVPTGQQAATITILATNGADALGGPQPLQGEWSFAAWVEAGDRAILFDTGWSTHNVLHNAQALGIDLSRAEELVLSHNHGDHTGGLETLRTELAKRNAAALSRIHVARGIFASRPRADGGEGNPMIALRPRLEALGSTFVIHDEPAEIAPGVWVTGPVPRAHAEHNYPVREDFVVLQEGRTAPDTIPESQSLVVVATGGPIVVSGCGHAGLINTLDYARATISPNDPQAAIGGFHLFNASEETLLWTAEKLSAAGLGSFLGSHCTGFETVGKIRRAAHLAPEAALIGAVGTRFEAGAGIVPGLINRQ